MYDHLNLDALIDLAQSLLQDRLPTAKKLKILKANMTRLASEEQQFLNNIYDKPQEAWLIEIIIDQIKKEKETIAKEIKFLKFANNNDNSKSTTDLENAKTVLITNLLQFNRAGFTKCLWHGDHSPSLHYDKKRNKVHCFSCGVDKDALDVIQKLHGFDLNKSIKYLINK